LTIEDLTKGGLSMVKRIVIMLVVAGLLAAAIFGFRACKNRLSGKSIAYHVPPVSVSTAKADMQSWTSEIEAVGSLSAVRGVDVASEVSGLVSAIHFKSGDQVKEGQVLVQLNAEPDIAQLHSFEASAELAAIVLERDKKQFEAQAISQASLDADAADLKSKQALVAQQSGVVKKKTILAPFSGKLGITSVNPGQYINSGDKIVTLQALDWIYADFLLPQQNLSVISVGQLVTVISDTYPGRTFEGKITSINPKVDPATRNVQVEATIKNSKHELFPGMYATVKVQAGAVQSYLTLPRTAVTFNPYGETVYIVEEGERGPDGKPALTVKEAFVTVGPLRGDQIAVLKGVKEGDTVVTSGQLKLRSSASVVINNMVQPSAEASPNLADE
jgi:membrane fusion protein, multidrug efflux system